MSNRSPVEEFGRPDPKGDITQLGYTGLLTLAGQHLHTDPYHALDLSAYMFRRAAEDGSDTLPSSHIMLQAVGGLALEAVANTAWPDSIKQDVTAGWQAKIAALDTEQPQDMPAA